MTNPHHFFFHSNHCKPLVPTACCDIMWHNGIMAWHKCIICIFSQLWIFLISSLIRTELLGADSTINTNPRLNLQGGGGLVTKSWPTLANPMDCSPPGVDIEKLFRWSNMFLYYLLNYHWNENAKFRNPHRELTDIRISTSRNCTLEYSLQSRWADDFSVIWGSILSQSVARHTAPEHPSCYSEWEVCQYYPHSFRVPTLSPTALRGI